MPKRIDVTRVGFTSCPSCLSHIEVAARLEDTACPFCGERLEVSILGPRGGAAMGLLRESRAGLVAAALAGLAFTACTGENNGNKDPGPDASVTSDGGDDAGDTSMQINNVEDNIGQQDYAGGNINNHFNNDVGQEPADMGDSDVDAG